ncbi:hypothetical protein ACOBQJ_00790 [Pelotomaculum propionicicum]|uniref:hypothetical protein n=1 Tax=Pelotomaculum propionicicum TaxID=258475 RepID=UPI003B7B08E1
MKKISIILIIFSVLLLQGCASLTKSRPLIENTNEAPDIANQRFQIVQEQGETNNIGGFTVIKDTLTGKEYLVVTGLNGSSTVTELK